MPAPAKAAAKERAIEPEVRYETVTTGTAEWRRCPEATRQPQAPATNSPRPCRRTTGDGDNGRRKQRLGDEGLGHRTVDQPFALWRSDSSVQSNTGVHISRVGGFTPRVIHVPRVPRVQHSHGTDDRRPGDRPHRGSRHEAYQRSVVHCAM
jgi:hypothetical protein